MNAEKKMSEAAEVRGPIERTEWKRDNYRHFHVVLPRVAFWVFSFFFVQLSARAFIKINFDANLLTVDLPTPKLDLGMDPNGPSESR